MPEPLVLVCGVDEKYAVGAAVMLHSALCNYQGGRELWIFILDAGIRPEQRRGIERVLERFGVKRSWIAEDTLAFEGLITNGYITAAAYLRLQIPSALPSELQRAIYLDSDLLVEGDLEELWETGLEGGYLAAVQDPEIPFVSSGLGLRNHRELGFAPDMKYFNSGVMILDLQRWREDDLAGRVFEYVRSNPQHVRWADQDGLNAVVAGRWRELPKRWNLRPEEGAEPGPHIVHFFSGRKPWRAFRLGSAGRRWHEYLRHSGYLGLADRLRYAVKSRLLYTWRWVRRRPER